MRYVARRATFGLNRRVLVDKWTLFVRMALDASRVDTGAETCLFCFESAMRVMAITAAHRALKHLMV